MQPLIVDDQIWELFPEAQFQVLVAHGIDNHLAAMQTEHYQAMLDNAVKEAQRFITDDVFRNNPVISEWRDAFTKFKKKKGARSSIEALLKRVSQGKSLSPINPLVDIYNSISLEFGVPCGSEDLRKMDGTMHLGVAKGGESFRPLGVEEDEPALPGEVIYYDQTGAICRCFNWREAQRTMLTDETTDAVLVIEAVNADQAQRAQQAAEELQQRIKTELGVDAERMVLKK
ncbi:phenylalanine--tRNA ligase beta subunit-related protein [Pediococcus acidilactici]|uniref:B3/B4 domain-containing protein n=1 Tax=Pediococcus acidilactici TaxID=1254 RepID=UPI002F263A70